MTGETSPQNVSLPLKMIGGAGTGFNYIRVYVNEQIAVRTFTNKEGLFDRL